MVRPLQKFVAFSSRPRGAAVILISWLLIIIVLSGIAPSAKPFAINSGEGSVDDRIPSAVAREMLGAAFPAIEGLPVLLVFHSAADQPITPAVKEQIAHISSWLSSNDRPAQIVSSLPFHDMPDDAQNRLYSEDGMALILTAALSKELESSEIYNTLQQIDSYVKQTDIGSIELTMTGPAAIAADTVTLFKNADLVLLFATIGLILIILIVIYRSPLLAVIPLVIAGIVYMVVDRLLGMAAENGWFVVDKQALSIMMILLFAVLTDYCLFIFSRYREELSRIDSKYEAMQQAMRHVAEPILFSGGTVLIAMLTLIAAMFKPYHYFAPVFSVAMCVMLLAGLTLIPAVFAILGRRSFWPFPPKLSLDEGPQGNKLWRRTGAFVTRKPGMTAGILLLVLTLAAVNAGAIQYSFNMMKSFPEDIASRQGFDILEQKYPPGQLAPVSIILQSSEQLVADKPFMEQLASLVKQLESAEGVAAITPQLAQGPEGEAVLPDSAISKDKQAVLLQAVLTMNPYDEAALDIVQTWLDDSAELLKNSGMDSARFSLHLAGGTAEQVDVRAMNLRDTLMIIALMTLFITIMLAMQSRSILLSLWMILTILLSYAATLGLSWLVFHGILGYESISYRLPLYCFVFLVALGVDYNIMLVSRIREEAREYSWKAAVERGVAATGGVISSAGIILAATFGVLMTQPLQELYLFGFMMALGILIDTFIVRGMLLPSILVLASKRK
ncbi:Apo-petrobactin exporter [Paenibacillus plantiphilus]|uniref:Apo-petrobactin exporter n=1 Tax=Paenibacillus plantiphilus TaxID=2905650 RepID=A0ABN8GW18_9BACL|nr:MMPL family transporter [Paenibacillus plantiphilus]CAH1217394.1 Apo-petrobactin exporter [Paenibacillus plantiphilus]